MSSRLRNARVFSACRSVFSSNNEIFQNIATNGIRLQLALFGAHASPQHFSQDHGQLSKNPCTIACARNNGQLRHVKKTPLRLQDGLKRWFTSTPSSRDDEEGNSKLAKREWTTRVVELPVGGSGTITLDISTHTEDEACAERHLTRRRNVLIHLPAGPSLEAAKFSLTQTQINTGGDVNEHETLLERILLSDTSTKPEHEHEQPIPTTIVVKVNYRLSPIVRQDDPSNDHRYPSPIHDVSTAFDWLLRNQDILCANTAQDEKTPNEGTEAEMCESRISIFGSHIGGSLALMLALTEPNDIHAVVVCDPVVDWVGLDELAVSSPDTVLSLHSSKKRLRAEAEETKSWTQKAAKALIDVRTQLFRTPSGFFDAFASPLMFLRAPGRDTPLWRTAKPGLEETKEDSKEMRDTLLQDGQVEVSSVDTRELVGARGYGPYDDDWHTAESGIDVNGGANASLPPSSTTQSSSSSDLEQTTRELSNLHIDHQPITQQRQPETDLSQPQPSPLSLPPEATDNDTVAQQLPTDPSLSTPQTATSFNTLHTPSITPTDPPLTTRRRKVLRRWPPIGRPEDVELPYTRIYSTLPAPLADSTSEQTPANGHVDLAYILHPQAKEMVDVMQRACFWGRERSLGEERVELVVVENRNEDGNVYGRVGAEFDVLRRAAEWFRKICEVEK